MFARPKTVEFRERGEPLKIYYRRPADSYRATDSFSLQRPLTVASRWLRQSRATPSGVVLAEATSNGDYSLASPVSSDPTQYSSVLASSLSPCLSPSLFPALPLSLPPSLPASL